jgi:uncharacterized membrane protein YphA (DoxX/SURF4 family)
VLHRADRALAGDPVARLVARIVGVVFVPAGLVKFLAYGWELDAFERFGLPFAPAWVIAAGVIEAVGAVCLVWSCRRASCWRSRWPSRSVCPASAPET